MNTSAFPRRDRWRIAALLLFAQVVLVACERPAAVTGEVAPTAAGSKSASASPALPEDEAVEALSSEAATADPAKPEVRFALILTVEDYPALPGPLANPHEDGERVAAALSAAGFNVRHVKDPTARDIETEVETFAGDLARSKENAVGFVYYSGHGGSVDRGGIRRNYILPGKTPIGDGQELAIKGVRITDLMEDLETAQAKAVFIVVDACRNTLPITSEKGGETDKGFVPYQTKPGLFVAFAVADGETTPDDGLYSTELAKAIRAPNISHDRAFTLANRAVAKKRVSGKTPVTSDGLQTDIVFVARQSVTPPPAPSTNTASIPFTYFPPGSLLSSSGAIDRTVWAPDIAFPIKDAPAYLGSQIYSAGGGVAGGNQCSPSNYVYPWIDNFCESRSSGAVGYNCPQAGHLGSDIRAGDVGTCQRLISVPSSERTLVEVVAVEDGIITNVGSYSVALRPKSATCDMEARDGPTPSLPDESPQESEEDRCVGRIYRYLHLNMNKLKVAINQEVRKGEVIGYLSNDFGASPTTLHLHFEIKANLADSGWAYVSPYMSLVRAYERDRGMEGIMLNAIRR
jgi:hypothetical protein